MKKFFVSTGLAAIGVAGLQSAYGQGLDIVSPKAWSVSGTLRGFYDDNYNLAHTKKGSWGTEVSPSVSLNVPLRQTDMGIRYTYGLYYYNDRDQLGVDPFDQSHQVDVWLDHAINQNWKLNLNDSFIYGRSPDLTNPSDGTLYRVQGDNIANHAHVSLDTQWTKLFGTSLSYGNDFYSYENHGGTTTPSKVVLNPFSPFPPPGTQLSPIDPGQPGSREMAGSGASLAGLLDRVEQNVGLDLNWTLSPETTFFVGGSYAWVNYTAGEPIAVLNYVPKSDTTQEHSYVYNSDARDYSAYGGHVGMTHQLTGSISLSGMVGAQFSDSSNDPFNHQQNVSPTANVSINYTYLPGSYVMLSVNQAHNATDVAEPGANNGITQYQDTTGVSLAWNHKITEKLLSTLIGQYTYSTYTGGASESATDSGYSASINLNYQITRHFSADLGYNFDDLESGLLGRGFIRNRVYLGLSASY